MVSGQISAKEAITRIQNMRDEALVYAVENDREGEWLDSSGSWVDQESERDAGEAYAVVDTFDRVLDVLQLLAYGITPEQGS